MRKLLLTLALALMAAPAVALADLPSGPDKANAARACENLRDQMGLAMFKLTYGTNADRSNAVGVCVSRWTRTEHQNRHDAAEKCAAERAAGEEAFVNKYGVGPRKANAFGRCVSSNAKAASAEQQQATVNAAKQCKAERAAMGAEALKQKYGTNVNKSNAFGKCVSMKAKAQNDTP